MPGQGVHELNENDLIMISQQSQQMKVTWRARTGSKWEQRPQSWKIRRKEMQWMSNSLVIINMDGDDPTKAKDQMGAF